jgi:hypothetical protein
MTVGDRPSCAILSSKAVQSSNLLRLCGSSDRAARDHIGLESEVFTIHGKHPLVSQYYENSVYDVGGLV